jgi:hypothetical protein
LFSIAIHPFTLASLFRLDPAIDKLLQRIERAASVAQHCRTAALREKEVGL